MNIDQKLKELDKAKVALEKAQEYITEAGSHMCNANGRVLGVHGNPFQQTHMAVGNCIFDVQQRAKEIRMSSYDGNGDLIKGS